jgi:clan AA aspartic protease
VAIHGSAADEGSEPEVPLTVLDVSDQAFETQAVIDTGFSGELILPSETILRLGYPYAGAVGGTLADGSEAQVDYYEGRVLWLGQRREVIAIAAEGQPLIGMELLLGSRLVVEVTPGGEVVVEKATRGGAGT